MNKRSIVLGTAALIGTAALVATTATVCAQDPQQKGQARVVERRGPEVELHQNAKAQVVVLFPASIQPQGNTQNDVEICLAESQFAAASPDGQGQQQPAQSTGREILFSSRDAQNGVVSYSLDAFGNGRKLMVLARVSGEMVEVRQTGGSEGVMFFTVQRPQAKDQAAQNNNAQAAPQADGSQPQPQQQDAQQAQAVQNGSQAQGQMDQAQTHQLQQGSQQEQAAIIIVYTAGGQQ